MCPCDLFLGVSSDRGWLVDGVGGGVAGGVRGRRWGCRGIVGFEDIEALELLVQDGEGLELLRLLHLRLKPVLDLILLFDDEVLVVVVEVSGTVRSAMR
jgi:hypothetical protein